MMNQKEQLISEINALRDKIGHFKIYLNKDTNEQLSIGYYFDKEKKLWTSYYINDFTSFQVLEKNKRLVMRANKRKKIF